MVIIPKSKCDKCPERFRCLEAGVPLRKKAKARGE